MIVVIIMTAFKGLIIKLFCYLSDFVVLESPGRFGCPGMIFKFGWRER